MDGREPLVIAAPCWMREALDMLISLLFELLYDIMHVVLTRLGQAAHSTPSDTQRCEHGVCVHLSQHRPQTTLKRRPQVYVAIAG